MVACWEVIRSAPNPKIKNITLRKAYPISDAASKKTSWSATCPPTWKIVR